MESFILASSVKNKGSSHRCYMGTNSRLQDQLLLRRSRSFGVVWNSRAACCTRYGYTRRV